MKVLATFVSLLYHSVNKVKLTQGVKMLRGFIRTTKSGPTRQEQETALKNAGIADVSEDGPIHINDRTAAIQKLNPGDTLVVSEPSRLGGQASDVLKALAAVGGRGADVMRADTGAVCKWHKKAQDVLDFALEAGSTNNKISTSNARETLQKSGKHRGLPPIDWTDDKLKQLAEMKEGKRHSRHQMAEALGISRATLQRKLAELRNKDLPEKP